MSCPYCKTIQQLREPGSVFKVDSMKEPLRRPSCNDIIFEEKEERSVRDKGNPTYKAGDIEVIDFINAWQLDFMRGSVIKYIIRYGSTGLKTDIEKAIHYCELILERDDERRARISIPREADVADTDQPTVKDCTLNPPTDDGPIQDPHAFERRSEPNADPNDARARRNRRRTDLPEGGLLGKGSPSARRSS